MSYEKLFNSINRDAFRRVIEDIESEITYDGKPVVFDMNSLFRKHNCGTAACIVGYLNLQFNPNAESLTYFDDSVPMLRYVFRDLDDIDYELYEAVMKEITEFIYIGYFSRYKYDASKETAIYFLNNFVENFTWENFVKSKMSFSWFLRSFLVPEQFDKENPNPTL